MHLALLPLLNMGNAIFIEKVAQWAQFMKLGCYQCSDSEIFDNNLRADTMEIWIFGIILRGGLIEFC